jgi:MurNAc alpha-1-phosphate uridylyltransferase
MRNIPRKLREAAAGASPLSDPLASDTAMVLAAGLGKRMRPLTAPAQAAGARRRQAPDRYSLDHLADAGVAKAVVNVHYLADALEAHLACARGAIRRPISDERELLLETGGGMIKARRLLPDPFFCLNSDNIWLDGPRMSLRNCPRPGTLKSDGCAAAAGAACARAQLSGRAISISIRWGGSPGASRAGSRPTSTPASRLFRTACCAMRPQGPFSTNVLWQRAIEEGRLYGISHTGDVVRGRRRTEAIAPTEAGYLGGG